jgi:V/A-type H+-transporting ATPase subunit I
MGLAKVEKVQILAHAGVKMALLSALQEAGIVEVEEIDGEAYGLHFSTAELTDLDHLLHRLKHGLDFLSRWEEKGFVDKILAQKPALSRKDREDLLQFPCRTVLDKVEAIAEESGELQSHIHFLEKEVEFLFPLANLGLPLSCFKSSNSLEIMIVAFPPVQKDAFSRMVEEDAVWFEVILEEKRIVRGLLFCLKEDKALVEQRLKDFQASAVYLAEPILSKAGNEDLVTDIIARNEREIAAGRVKKEELEKEAEKMTIHRDRLLQLFDILQNERDKLATSRLLGQTERVVYLEGWIQSADAERLESTLAPFAEECEVYRRPPLADEDSPVILENPKPARPFEIITKLYGLPRRDSLDPTVSLSPFFFVFVGLCVSEAGYGLVVALLSLLYMKLAKPKGSALQFMKLLLLLGVSNIILGTLVGGWFGYPLRRLLILDPLQDPLKFLGLSLGLGFVQVWFGTMLSLIEFLKRKEIGQAVVKAGWLLMLPSLVAYFLTKQPAAGVLTIVGAAAIVLFAAPKRNPLARIFGGLYSLYGISGYLGDILSYSRLLALGLSTGVIAMVVNTLVKTASGIPWVGWLFAALVFVGGHLFNLAISFLGGFVHSMRLQFVEFFTKFFEAGGRPFRPLKMESKFVEFI